MQNLPPWVIPASLLGATLVNWLLAHLHKHTMTDTERADLLTTIAGDAAAVISAAYPTKPWAELVNLVIQRLLTAKALPTKSRVALENAATKALTDLGRSPNGH